METYRKVIKIDRVQIGMFNNIGDCGLESWGSVGKCWKCDTPVEEHGFMECFIKGIEHIMVCPGEFIVIDKHGHHSVLTGQELREQYQRCDE